MKPIVMLRKKSERYPSSYICWSVAPFSRRPRKV